MNFEIRQLSPWEDKKMPAFKEWLDEQIKLRPEDWGADFRIYVEMKARESETKNKYQELTAEEKREKTFRRYLDGLNITEQELTGKSILDVGCKEGDFIVSCIEKGIAPNAYGIDKALEGGSVNSEYGNNFFVGDFTEELPVKNLDYVVSVGALSLYLDEEHKIDAEVAISEAINAINEKGEIRIWPIKKALGGNNSDGIKESERVLAEIMVKLEKQTSIEWRLEPTDIRVGVDKDVWAEQVLIIRCKPFLDKGK